MKLRFKKKFQKRIIKMPHEIQNRVKSVLKILVETPYNESLRRHQLKGKLRGFETINVGGDIRLLIFSATNEIVDVIDVGSHSYFYG
jgi:addiction module RelE/StbE family toxin